MSGTPAHTAKLSRRAGVSPGLRLGQSQAIQRLRRYLGTGLDLNRPKFSRVDWRLPDPLEDLGTGR